MTGLILITGGSRGIGAATAKMAAVRRHAVVVNYRERADAAEALVADIRASGGVAHALQADIAVEGDVERMFRRVDELGIPLIGLVNSAGVLDLQSRVEQMTAARISRILNTNVLGSFLCAREAVRRMSHRHGGRGGAIVNVSSGAARLGSPNEYVDYAASKGALDTMTIGLAKEVAAEGIRVNGVRPGHIYTEIHATGGEPGRVDRLAQSMVPMRRGGQPEEVAAAILWLLSDEASFTTGAIIDVTGGF